jgi:hypothetical protein
MAKTAPSLLASGTANKTYRHPLPTIKKRQSKMLRDGIDYDKTVESMRLVFKGQLTQKINNYFILCLIIASGLLCFYDKLKSCTEFLDYILVFIILVMTASLSTLIYIRLFNRDKLKEVVLNKNIKDAKEILIKTGKSLDWHPEVVTNQYIIFKTKYNFVLDSQSVTLIFFPNNKIYFNSLHYPNDYMYRANYMFNFEMLIKELEKLKDE